MLRLEGRGPDHLIFLPGFMTSAQAYREFLAPIAIDGVTVTVAQLYPRGIATLRGHHGVRAEAVAATELILREARSTPGRVFLGGHSRGGLAAWLAAGRLRGRLAGLCLVDPVDAGSRTGGPPHVRQVAGFDFPALILAAGVPGPCAPPGRRHERFARATPGAAHVILNDLGHADILNGWERTFGRTVCRSGIDPDRARGVCSALVGRFLGGFVPDVGAHEDFDRVR